MAVRAGIVTYPQRGIIKVVWSGLLLGDTGDFQAIAGYPDRTVFVKGTFGVGGRVDIEGSHDGGTQTAVINDSRGEGNLLSFSGQDIKQALENPELIRPIIPAGDGTTNLTCTIIGTNVNKA